MSRPTTRVLTLLEILQDHPGVGGRELAERLGVDARTVRRYASRLQELGIPVEAQRGRHGGYRLRPGYKLPPLMLDDDEATAVVLGLVAARRFGLATAEPAVDGALAKIQRVLPAALRERVRAVEATLGFVREPARADPPAADTLLTLADAARRRRRVHVRYAGRDGPESERDIDPYGVVFHAGRWYLAAFDHLRNEVRTFRVDRVRAATATRTTAAIPEGFDAAEHVARSLARVPWRWEVEVLLETTLREARRRIPLDMAEVTEVPGGVLMRGRAERLDGMARILAGLEWPFTIRRPAELRDALREHAAALARAAQA
jgi:predicted DNA-binding transcriptional regulator YafY